MKGRGTQRGEKLKAQTLLSSWVHLLLQWEGRDSAGAVDRGLWSPHCSGGSSWSNCLEIPRPRP